MNTILRVRHGLDPSIDWIGLDWVSRNGPMSNSKFANRLAVSGRPGTLPQPSYLTLSQAA